MKPVRLPAAATVALPRWGLFALCLLYILPGLIGRDPWKGDDAAGFGIIWTMAHGGLQDWLWPNVVGLPMADEGPLSFWIGALFVKLFGWLIGDPLAARLSTAVFFLLGSLSVWYSTYLLGRRAEAQPLKLAFGGQPDPQNFGKTLADGALLIYLGCWGLLLRSHETSAEALQISLIAYSLYLSVRLFDAEGWRSALKLGVILGLLVLTRGWILPLCLSLALLVLPLFAKQRRLFFLILGSIAVACLIVAAWLYVLHAAQPFGSSPTSAWIAWNEKQFNAPTLTSISYFFKYGIWFAWPAWPFAAWAIYAWRYQEKALHIRLPVAFLACFFILAIANTNSEEAVLLPILPPLAILAAFGLPTMKRSTINAVDWFAVMVMTGVAALFWFGWIAAITGWPARTANKVLSWAPGFVPEFYGVQFLIALLATVAWFAIVYWRISTKPAVLWRAVVLSGGGVILCWLLIMTLWLPLLDNRVSYAPIAKNASTSLPASYRCIDSNLGASQRASFAYFGQLRFARFNQQDCDVLMLQTTSRLPPPLQFHAQDFPEAWTAVWQGRRPSDKSEIFTLYVRKQ
jgi:4-amino-4-deoxy-L-arabinose transferase-like glycosyltransferase